MLSKLLLESWHNNKLHNFSIFETSDFEAFLQEAEDFLNIIPAQKTIDVVDYRRDGKITIDSMKFIRHKTIYKNNEQSYNFIIIIGVEFMTNALSNSLLKWLEEPSDNVYVIASASDLARVQQTILSRANITRKHLIQNLANNHDDSLDKDLLKALMQENPKNKSLTSYIHKIIEIDLYTEKTIPLAAKLKIIQNTLSIYIENISKEHDFINNIFNATSHALLLLNQEIAEDVVKIVFEGEIVKIVK
jgi:DNA polymerase III delta prime subunit